MSGAGASSIEQSDHAGDADESGDRLARLEAKWDRKFEALARENRKLRQENNELRKENSDLLDRVGRLEAKERGAKWAAEKSKEAAEGAQDAAQTAVDMATKAQETADDATDLAEDIHEKTEKHSEVYKEMVGKVQSFESRLEEFQGELELSEYDSGSTKDRVKRVLLDQLLYKAYHDKNRTGDASSATAGLEYSKVYEVAETNHIDIERSYGYTIARELSEEKQFVRTKKGGERNTGKGKKLSIRYGELPESLQKRGRDLYESNNAGGNSN